MWALLLVVFRFMDLWYCGLILPFLTVIYPNLFGLVWDGLTFTTAVPIEEVGIDEKDYRCFVSKSIYLVLLLKLLKQLTT